MDKPKYYITPNRPTDRESILAHAEGWASAHQMEMITLLMEVADATGMELGDEGAEWFLFVIGGQEFSWNPDDGWHDPDRSIRQLAYHARGLKLDSQELDRMKEALSALQNAFQAVVDLCYTVAASIESAETLDEYKPIGDAVVVSTYGLLRQIGALEVAKERFDKRCEKFQGEKDDR